MTFFNTYKYLILSSIFASLPLVSLFFIKLHEKEKNNPMAKTAFECEIEEGHGRKIYKIYFEDHSYVFLQNTWSASGDQMLHDPSCACLTDE